jgi:hypothetical protein
VHPRQPHRHRRTTRIVPERQCAEVPSTPARLRRLLKRLVTGSPSWPHRRSKQQPRPHTSSLMQRATPVSDASDRPDGALDLVTAVDSCPSASTRHRKGTPAMGGAQGRVSGAHWPRVRSRRRTVSRRPTTRRRRATLYASTRSAPDAWEIHRWPVRRLSGHQPRGRKMAGSREEQPPRPTWRHDRSCRESLSSPTSGLDTMEDCWPWCRRGRHSPRRLRGKSSR